jgi:hypothetical protein
MATTRTGALSVNQMVGYGLGAVYVLAGLLGFVVAGGDVDFAGPDGELLLGLRINHLHNIAHLLIGAALLYGAWRGTEMARKINLAVGVTYLLLGVIGLFIDQTDDVNILALNGADNGLHLVTGALLTGVALAMDKARTRSRV